MGAVFLTLRLGRGCRSIKRTPATYCLVCKHTIQYVTGILFALLLASADIGVNHLKISIKGKGYFYL